MLLVLDSNEYIFNFGHDLRKACEDLLELIAANPQDYEVRVCRTIVDEVRRNLSPMAFKDFWHVMEELGVSMDEDWEVPFELGAKYEALGLKEGDAFIAAYAEWTGAECLITENRDFLSLVRLPFKVLRAEKFLAHHAQ